MSPNNLWWNAQTIHPGCCRWNVLKTFFSYFCLSPTPPSFDPLSVLNKLLEEEWKLLFKKTQLQLDNRKQMPIICQWLLENKTFYDIYSALAELLLRPKKNKLVKLPAAAFEMRVIIIWSLVLHPAFVQPNTSLWTDFPCTLLWAANITIEYRRICHW